MKDNRLYNDLAWLWPFVSRPAEYAVEAEMWGQALRSKTGPGRHRLLELGVGGGHNLHHLKERFEVTATDISESMLAHSRVLNPEVEHLQGDMRTLRLNHIFDAVIIHDAIMYMQTEAELRAVFTTAATHLRPGGVFLTAPDFYRETFRDPGVSHTTRTEKGTTVTVVEYQYDPDVSDTAIESLFTFYIRRDGALQIEEDRHTLGIFPFQTWVDLLAECGFDVEKHPYLNFCGEKEIPMLAGILQ